MKHLSKRRKWLSLILWAMVGYLVILGISNVPFSLSAHATEPLSTEVSQSSSAQILLDEGIEHFQSERYGDAVRTWQQALDAYAQMSDELHQALVLSNLSLAYQHLGQWEDAKTNLDESLAFFDQQAVEFRSIVDWAYYAKALNAQGWLHLRQGQPEPALESWRDAALAYELANNIPGIVGSQINQAQALQSLGLSVATQDILNDVHTIIQEESDSDVKAIALQSLGNGLRRVGKLEESQAILEESLAIATSNAPITSTSEQYDASQRSILLDLANTDRALWNRAIALNLDEADTHYADALRRYHLVAESNFEQPKSSLLRAKAIANILSLLIDHHQLKIATATVSDSQQLAEIWSLWDRLKSEFAAIPYGRSGIEVQLNTTSSILKFLSLQQDYDDGLRTGAWTEVSQVLAQSIQQARALHDRRTEATALGQLGHLYEQAHQWDDARSVTQEAIALSESIQASDIQYRWEWQLGRVLKQQGKPESAITVFDQSVATLEQVRKDLLFIDSEVQFSFRDDVEPLYRQFVDLLLRDSNAGKENLQKATELIDSLQLAELENYLGCNIDPVQLSEKVIDPNAAIMYPIILGNTLTEQQSERLEVVLQMPDQTFHRSTLPISSNEFDTLTTKLYNELPVPTRWRSAQQDSGQLYDLLIRPFETVLNGEPTLSPEHSIKTLVFVLDGALRNIPMAVLWDGDRQQYLLERYAVAIAPSLRVVEPQPLRRPIKVLAAGSSEALQHPFRDNAFSPLQNVETELNAIEALGSLQRSLISTDVLFNSTFTKNNLEKQLQRHNYSIVHLASHGVFSSDPERTFIALPDPDRIDSFPDKAAEKENYAIFSNELDTLLRNRNQEGSTIELLVLSACQTATGDDRATLGLAGLTVRAGARSTLATLWSVDDASAATMMGYFYQQLAENAEISRSEALRQAQIYLWETEAGQRGNWKRPYFWAPYILAGNWL